MSIQWYPGHMAKARRMIEEDVKLCDLVIEIIDARIPESSRNPDIEAIAAGRARMILLNKADMADERQNRLWLDEFEGMGISSLLINSKTGEGTGRVSDAARTACAGVLKKYESKGVTGRPIRAIVCGIPNVGKSTFINAYTKGAHTKTGNRPGVTKGRQWVRISKTIELLDTPGILWPKLGDERTGINLAVTGSINDDILNEDELSISLVNAIASMYPGRIHERYGVDESADAVNVVNEIALRRGALKKGGEPDFSRAARLILNDFRSGRLGRITLEKCDG